ncbi:MAG: hypothetical protein WBL20_14355 [Sphingobium sp.]|uniref:hypothetical protein n=1 Tax=Sphingobium sp. TaxID=1912891 RepID=UPI002E1DB1F6
MNSAPTIRMRNPELAAWTILRFALAPVGLAEIILANDAGDAAQRPTVADTLHLLNRWRGAGLIERIEKPESYIMQAKARTFRDPPAVGEPAREPKARSTRQRIWSAVRVMRSFDLVEICFAATVEARAARRVLNQLTRAGYLRRTDRLGDDQPRWRLSRPSGPTHPRVEYAGRTVVALVDANSGQRFPLLSSQKILAGEIHHVS